MGQEKRRSLGLVRKVDKFRAILKKYITMRNGNPFEDEKEG